MTTRMEGIEEYSLFSNKVLTMDVMVDQNSRYRVLAERLPWRALGEEANRWRAKKVDINNGRPLDLRLHLGALIAQGMNGWTDRETEDMVAHHAGVRVLCGLLYSRETIDHTSIETFRNQLGKEGVEGINRIVVQSAVGSGFTGSGLCASDTTVQESPISYPSEVSHLKNIAKKLCGIGLKLRKKLSKKLAKLSEAIQYTFTKIRLFTRGKGKDIASSRKKLAQELRVTVGRMERLVRGKVNGLNSSARASYAEAMAQYRLMLEQIRHWMKTGFHRPGKLVSLWETNARAIVRNKASKAVEFGRRWIVTRLTKGYIIGTVVAKLGGDSDARIMDEVLSHFERMMGKLPALLVYDRGGDGPVNHKTLAKQKILHNGIFCKGKVSQPGLGRNTALKARRERALTEASISTIKHPRFGFNRPRARSSEGCVLKGHVAILGANLARFARDWMSEIALAAG